MARASDEPAVDEMGAGPPILFVPGLSAGGAEAWRAQWPLAARWRLRFVRWPTMDLEAGTAQIAEALGEGAHLVGHSDGAVLALLAAARRPRATWSLLAIEPPASRAARGDPDVDAYEQAIHAQRSLPDPLWNTALPTDGLMAATFPKLFLSGGHQPAFEAICDALALQLGGDRKVLRGAGHRPQDLGERFNAVVEAFARAEGLP